MQTKHFCPLRVLGRVVCLEGTASSRGSAGVQLLQTNPGRVDSDWRVLGTLCFYRLGPSRLTIAQQLVKAPTEPLASLVLLTQYDRELFCAFNSVPSHLAQSPASN